MIIDELARKAARHYGVCVGLDTSYAYLPEYLKNSDLPLGEKIFSFNKCIIDATGGETACYKLQIAYYEAMGLEGLAAYSKTLKYLKDRGHISIADVKRGDISATGEQYSAAHFSGDFEADMATVNVYMGFDAMSPWMGKVREGSKAVFALVKTSNPSGVDLQDATLSDGKPVYERMARLVSEWGRDSIGESGYSGVGAVMGLTYPHEFAQAKAEMPHTFFLIPGYGAQGGTGKDIAEIFAGGICGIVNSSRGIITAHQKDGLGFGFEDASLKAVLAMKRDISQWL